MAQQAAAVFTGGDAALEPVLVRGDIEPGVCPLRRIHNGGVDTNGQRLLARVADLELEPGACWLGIDPRECPMERRICPVAEIGALDQDLRRIDKRRALQLREASLA